MSKINTMQVWPFCSLWHIRTWANMKSCQCNQTLSELHLEAREGIFKQILLLFTSSFLSRPAFIRYKHAQIKVNPTSDIRKLVSPQQSHTGANGTRGDAPSLWTKESFRNRDGLRWHWANPSAGVMTITVHTVVSLPAAACLNFHHSDPDERNWVVSPGRRVSSDVVTLELRAPSAPCVSLAVLLLQLLAPLHPTVFAAPHFPTVSSPHPPLSLAHHPVVCGRVTDSPSFFLILPSLVVLVQGLHSVHRVYPLSDAHHSVVPACQVVLVSYIG